MKIGICQICQKEFKLTKDGSLHRHGYKQEIRQKTWHGIVSFTKRFYVLTMPPCPGTGIPAVRIKEKRK